MRCAICGKEADSKIVFNFMEVWREGHEWSAMPQKGVPCKDCIGWMRDKEGFKNVTLRNEPMPNVTGPQRYWEDVTATSIGIFDGELLGLRCAKFKHGCDAIGEVLRGFYYQTEGEPIKRATTEDVLETERCASCHLSLWACNALEVTV